MDENSTQLQNIPVQFHQDAEQKEFSNCTFCGNDLGTTTPYVIEKSIKYNREKKVRMTVFEYAICQACSIKKMQAMSTESVKNIQAYMQENVLSEMQAKLTEKTTFEDKTSSCPVTGASMEDMDEYSMVGQFIGNKMIVREFPFVINASVGEEMQDLLSVETKKEFDDFMDTITGIPPELKSLFKTNRPVLV